MSDVNPVSRYEDATSFIASMQDPKLRAVLEYALATVLMRRGMNPSVAAVSEFDLRYFLEAIKAMFDDEGVIRAIMEGNDTRIRWW